MVQDYPRQKIKKKVLDHYLHHDLGMSPLLWCFFAHLLILKYSDHHHNLISSSVYYPGPLHTISSQSVHNLLSNVVHQKTDRQTNATKNITSFCQGGNKWTFLLYQHVFLLQPYNKNALTYLQFLPCQPNNKKLTNLEVLPKVFLSVSIYI